MADSYSVYCPKCNAYSNLTNRIAYRKHKDGVATNYSIEECNNCEQHFLVATHASTGERLAIYPKTLSQIVDSLVPAPIRQDFEEALLCYSVSSYRGAAALARRTVQVICLDKGAGKSKKLQEQIDELFTNGVITKDIKEWAHEVRFLGNDAAHPTKNEVTKEDAKDILELLESLSEVLYITPAKATERKKRRGNTPISERGS